MSQRKKSKMRTDIKFYARFFLFEIFLRCVTNDAFRPEPEMAAELKKKKQLVLLSYTHS